MPLSCPWWGLEDRPQDGKNFLIAEKGVNLYHRRPILSVPL